MSDGALFLVISVDIDPALDDRFHEWYEEVHVPEVLACPGFLGARRMVSPDREQRPRYVTIYEVEGRDVLETPEVRSVSGWGPFADDVSNYHRYWFEPTGTPRRAGGGDGS